MAATQRLQRRGGCCKGWRRLCLRGLRGRAWAAAACVPARAAGTTHGLRLGAARVGPARQGRRGAAVGAARTAARVAYEGGSGVGAAAGMLWGSARGLRGVDWRGQEGKYENTVELIESHGQTKR
ncbi:hypothetical protein GUJ93_ZPchr0452g16385 [Zizania palustris]|uniref:Uncharacterized protein n=1 Tax=Zizania palustris TaxID=103762 RepID=A0A8J5RDQ0_ZIZPA|nr:hypothetical protein GUJ93_ZPchr0452g16385 [Zizania palustris]